MIAPSPQLKNLRRTWSLKIAHQFLGLPLAAPGAALGLLCLWLIGCSNGGAPTQQASSSSSAETSAASVPAPASPTMTAHSYPAFGFDISFPASWTVRNNDEAVEAREDGASPSQLDAPSSLSPEQQDIADIAFLKSVHVNVVVQDTSGSLLDGVQNRIQGSKMMHGQNVSVEPIEHGMIATTSAFITRTTQKWTSHSGSQITTYEVIYDFDHGAHRYVLALTSPLSGYDEHTKTFDAIIRSLVFTQ
jgi:hypothetical protein